MTASHDAIVLGAGVVGVSAALHLAKRGLSVALVDRRDGIGWVVRNDDVGEDEPTAGGEDPGAGVGLLPPPQLVFPNLEHGQ